MNVLLILLLLVVVYHRLRAQPLPICQDQLFNVYRSLGMTNTVSQPPILFQAVDGGVQVDFNFESVARLYQTTTPEFSTEAPPVVNFVSFDVPWCVDSIDVICGGVLLQGLPKSAECPIVDFDTGRDPQAGRIFVYANEASLNITQPPSCAGNIRLVLHGGITIGPPPNGTAANGVYTYDWLGLAPNFVNLTQTEAISSYQDSPCDFTSGVGVPPVEGDQSQLVCVDRLLGCTVVPRPGSSADKLVPSPAFACRGQVTEGGPTVIVWQVSFYGMQVQNIFTVNYGIHFCQQNDLACRGILTPEDQTGDAGTRRQYISPYNDFTSIEVLTFQGNNSFATPIYPLAVTDPFIRNVPCICFLSIDCHSDGSINLDMVSKILKPNNVYPIANASQNQNIVAGHRTVSLLGESSFDPDNGPNTLSFDWVVYNTTPSPVFIDDPRAPNVEVTADFVVGNYTFIMYLSDGQDVVNDLVDVIVVENIVHAVLPPDFAVQYQIITVCPPDGELPPLSLGILLNGSASFSENPQFDLSYNWTQTAGNPIAVPFFCDNSSVGFLGLEAFIDQNQAIAIFFPPQLGVYTFRLTVSDGNPSRDQYSEIQISVEQDFVSPNSTDLNLTDFPNAPIHNNTAPEVPTISFPPPPSFPTGEITLPPSVSSPPSVPTSAPTVEPIPPGLFPKLPPPSMAERAVILFAFIACIFLWILLIGYMIAQAPLDVYHQWDVVPTVFS